MGTEDDIIAGQMFPGAICFPAVRLSLYGAAIADIF